MRVTLTVLALAATTLANGFPASAQEGPTAGPGGPGVNVVVNGSPVQFDQPPVERAGRIFVPLRGVFERLGASVVFQNGQINATSGRHTIALTLGSTTAQVDGRPTVLDSPPFLIGARTLVPLRFISQALGANVNYDGSQDTVYVTLAGPPPRAFAPPPAPVPAGPVALRLFREEPAAHASVDRRRPEISSAFSSPVVADSVRIMLDDRDVTPNAYLSDASFAFTPEYDLPTGPHTVVVRGRIVGGPPFVSRWTFVSNAVDNANVIDQLLPANGERVGRHFTVQGRTLPNARVRLVATTNATIERFSDEVMQGSQRVDVVADDRGSFTASFDVDDAREAGEIDVRIVSTAPDASVAVRTLRLRS